jgi:hypothetical protein
MNKNFSKSFWPLSDGSDYLFEREHHVRIASILQALDGELLLRHHCWFGGGTAIVLLRNEYRESIDIDFLISDREGYRALRLMLTDRRGIESVCRPGLTLTPASDIRADQYGIRTMLSVAGVEIKFEIVLEGRILLETPSAESRICGVPTLTPLDMASCKLLANSDRWSDGAVFSRDLIDLAMLDLPRPELKRAIEKAKMAYGQSIERDLAKSIQALADQKGRLEVCMSALKIDGIPKTLLWKRIRNLQPV